MTVGLIQTRTPATPEAALQHVLHPVRQAAGQAGWRGGFVERYLTAAIYPDGLTPYHQVLIGALVLAINLGVYALVLRRAARQRAMT